MNDRVRDLTANLDPRSPGDPEQLRDAAAALDFAWPDDYAQFMTEQDGGEGFVGKAYLSLWPAADLVDLNRGYGFAEFAPDLVGFGSDGGGECFAFDRRRSPPPIVMAPLVGLGQPIEQAATFVDFLERLRDGRAFDAHPGDTAAR